MGHKARESRPVPGASVPLAEVRTAEGSELATFSKILVSLVAGQVQEEALPEGKHLAAMHSQLALVFRQA